MPIINVSTTTATDWWEDLIKESESKKKPAVFKDDPVAMACAAICNSLSVTLTPTLMLGAITMGMRLA
jgi:hypothetical protein